MQTKVLNVRLLIITGLLVVVMSGIAYGVHRLQVNSYGIAFLREGRRARDANNLSRAIELFERYVSLTPADTLVLEEFGYLLIDAGRFDGGYTVLERVLQRDSTRRTARLKLAKLCLDSQLYSVARGHLGALLESEGSDDLEVVKSMALAELGMGETASAFSRLKASVESNPSFIDGHLLMARILDEEMENQEQAIQVLDNMVAQNDNSIDAFYSRGFWISQKLRSGMSRADGGKAGARIDQKTRQELVTRIASDAARMRELSPDGLDTLILSSLAESANENLDRAADYAARAIQAFPSDPNGYLTLAGVEHRLGRKEKVDETLRLGIASCPNDSTMAWTLAERLVNQIVGNQIEVSQELLSLADALERLSHPRPRVAYLRVLAQIGKESPNAAIALLEGILPDLAEWPNLAQRVNFEIADLHRVLGNFDQQTARMRQAVSLGPDWMPGRVGLAEALLASGHTDEAMEQYQYLSARGDSPSVVRLQLARLLILANLRLPQRLRDWKPVETLIDHCAESGIGDDVQISLLRAEVASAKGDQSLAASILADAKARNPDALQLDTASINLETARKNWARVDEIDSSASARFGDVPELRWTRAVALLLREGPDAADRLRQLAVPLDSWPGDKAAEFSRRMAELLFSIGDNASAIAAAKLAAAALPNDVPIRLLMLDAAAAGKAASVLTEVLADFHRIDPNGPLWRHGEAVRLISQDQPSREELQTAAEHLSAVRLVRQSWGRIPLLQGLLADKRRESSRAIQFYQDALSLGERNRMAVNRLITLLTAQKRYVEADQVIRRLQEAQTPFTDEMSRMAANLSYQVQDFDRGLNLADRFAPQSNRAQDRVLRGNLLAANGHETDAEQEFVTATKVEPDNPAGWTALIAHYARLGRRADVEATLAAAENQSTPLQAAYVMAECYLLLSRGEEAAQRYETAIANDPGNHELLRRAADLYLQLGRLELATRLMRTVVETADLKEAADNGSSTEERTQHDRRTLAWLLSVEGGAKRIDEAEQLLNLNASAPTDAQADDRVRALAVSRRGFRAARDQAISILERVIETAPAGRDDRLLLASLYNENGNASQARSQLQKAVAEHPDDVRALRSYVQWSFDAGFYSEAEVWLDQLEKLSPDDLSTRELRALVIAVAGRHAEARRFVRSTPGLSEQDLEQPSEETASRLLWAAELFVAMSFKSEGRRTISPGAPFVSDAIEFFTRYGEAKPSDSLALAEFQATIGQLAPAMDMLESRLESSSPARVAGIAIKVIGSPSRTDDDLKRLVAIVGKAAAIHSNSIELLLLYGDVLNWTGKVDQSLACYDAVLSQIPDHPIAINNRAFLLCIYNRDAAAGLAALHNLIKLHGPLGSYLDTRGLAYLATRQPEKAVADFEYAVRDMEDGERLFHLAKAYKALDRMDDAVRTMSRAIELGAEARFMHPRERADFEALYTEVRKRIDK